MSPYIKRGWAEYMNYSIYCASEAEAAVKFLSVMQYDKYVLITIAGVN